MMKEKIKNAAEYVNGLATVETWKEVSEIYGLVQTVMFGVKTLPIVVVVGTAEIGYRKTKEHIENKQMERFEVLMKQYEKNMNMNTTTVGL